MAKNYEKSIRAFLGEGTEFKGVITFEGTVRVDGVLEGEVITDDTFIIGTAANVKAEVKAGVVIVMGRMEGKIEAKEKCEIRVGSRVSGEIFTPSIYIEEGAVFEGTCHMTGDGGGSVTSAEEAKEAPGAEEDSGESESTASAPGADLARASGRFGEGGRLWRKIDRLWAYSPGLFSGWASRTTFITATLRERSGSSRLSGWYTASIV